MTIHRPPTPRLFAGDEGRAVGGGVKTKVGSVRVVGLVVKTGIDDERKGWCVLLTSRQGTNRSKEDAEEPAM